METIGIPNSGVNPAKNLGHGLTRRLTSQLNLWFFEEKKLCRLSLKNIAF